LTAATGQLVPGRIVLDGPFPVSVTFEVPQGWSRQGTTELADYVSVHKVRGNTWPLWLEWATIRNVYSDPCHPAAGQIDPPVGPSVDDLVTALTRMVGFSATAVTDVSVDGHAGKHFQLSDAIDPAAAGCDDSTWLSLWEPAAGGDTAKVPGPATMQFWIVDVDGTRVVMFTEQYGPTSNDMVELTRIVESIHIG